MPNKYFFRFFILVAMVTSVASYAVNDTYKKYSEIDASPVTKQGLTAQQRQELWTSAANHPVASLDVVDKYDKDGSIGFCFGRAMAAHLLARQRGLAPESIAKLFIVGDLRQGPNPEWRFHVTTLVKGSENGRWYAIDPIMTFPLGNNGPLLIEEWVRIVKRTWDQANKANLYLVKRNAVIPNMNVFYATPADEKGEFAIELKFNPKNRPGFKPVTLPSGVGIYEIDANTSDKHFLPANLFNFDKLEMKVIAAGNESLASFDYNNYFVELMQQLPFEYRGHGMRALSAVSSMESSNAYRAPSLHSLRVPVR